MTALFILLILLILLQVLDAWSTLKALKRPGTIEANPVLRWLMDKLGVTEALIGMKIIGCVAIWWGVMAVPADFANGLLIAACMLYAWVIHNNLQFKIK